MANSTFPEKQGHDNGYGQRILDAIRNGFPKAIPVVQWRYDFYIKHDHLTTAGLSQEIDLNVTFAARALPSNVRIVGAYFELVEVFAGGTISAITAELGDTGNTDEILTATNVFTGAGTGLKDPAWGAKIDGGTGPWFFEAAYAPVVKFTATDGNVNTANTGELRVTLIVEPINAQGAE